MQSKFILTTIIFAISTIVSAQNFPQPPSMAQINQQFLSMQNTMINLQQAQMMNLMQRQNMIQSAEATLVIKQEKLVNHYTKLEIESRNLTELTEKKATLEKEITNPDAKEIKKTNRNIEKSKENTEKLKLKIKESEITIETLKANIETISKIKEEKVKEKEKRKAEKQKKIDNSDYEDQG